MIDIVFEPDFPHWRDQARQLLAQQTPPEEIVWSESTGSQTTLFAAPAAQLNPPLANAPRVPKTFLDLAEFAACHSDPGRWDLLYRTLYRLIHGEPKLLAIGCDPDVLRLNHMRHTVHRDMHKMRAFVRFRKTTGPEGDRYIAWHRPDHHIVEANAPFFVRRFGAMQFAILTPDKSAFWDLETLRFGPGVARNEAPEGDDLELLWLDYYASIFNPARVKISAMKAEMPVRHWSTLPETALIPALIAQADNRVRDMAKKQPDSAARFIPASHELSVLAQAAKGCQGCDLYKFATQTVFGEGPAEARVMMVGEQPGDSEDLGGKPFVGPAGRLLDEAMHEAGVDRRQVYVTNAVKHFKFVERGKRRIHQKPAGMEISACRPWLEAEVSAVKPEILVCLGGTAAQSVMGRAVKVLTERGKLLTHHWARQALITIHPSAILRAPDEQLRASQYRSLVDDLRLIPHALAHLSGAASPR